MRRREQARPLQRDSKARSSVKLTALAAAVCVAGTAAYMSTGPDASVADGSNNPATAKIELATDEFSSRIIDVVLPPAESTTPGEPRQVAASATVPVTVATVTTKTTSPATPFTDPAKPYGAMVSSAAAARTSSAQPAPSETVVAAHQTRPAQSAGIKGLPAESHKSADLVIRFGPATSVSTTTTDQSATDATGSPTADAALTDGIRIEAAKPAPRKVPALRKVSVKVRAGDSLYSILRSRGIPGAVVPALLSGGDHGGRLKSLHPGQGLDLHLDSAGVLARMDYRIDDLTTVSYKRDDAGFASALTTLELERRKAHATGSIASSLFLDAQRVGLSGKQIMQIADIFGWDVDFSHDLRKGDRFTVVYEELLHEGKLIKQGDILAAEFVNQGQVHRAVRFISPDGRAQYFTPEGMSMRKAFRRSPVKFGRVSSRFNLKRRHPILHKLRAHKGVDYAASRGTPIMATGDGRVDFKGTKGGYGKTLVLRHGQSYTTLYAHVQKFARGIRVGKSVRQGEVIAYVGSSGLATGPHVHYEFRVAGRHKDPLRVKLPKSLPISPKLRRTFRNQTHKLAAMLDVYSSTSVAMR